MVESEEDDLGFVKRLLEKHLKVVLIAAAGVIAAFIAGIFVALWVLDFSGYGIKPLDTWTMGNVFDFLLRLALWEFVLVGIISISLTVVIGLHWWKRLPEDERDSILNRPNRRETRKNIFLGGYGSAIPLLTLVAFLIIIYIHGNWDTVLVNLSFQYYVETWILSLVCVLVIFGIPAGLALLWWFRRGKNKSS